MQLMPGTVISVDMGLYDHIGIVTDQYVNGVPAVISNSLKNGGVSEESLADFTGGHLVSTVGYLGNLPVRQVLQRARSKIGTKWDLLLWNCEHFVRWAHGLNPASPQVRRGFMLLAGIAALIYAKPWKKA